METIITTGLTAFEKALLIAEVPPIPPVIANLGADLNTVTPVSTINKGSVAPVSFKLNWQHVVVTISVVVLTCAICKVAEKYQDKQRADKLPKDPNSTLQ